jgi:hypothetical protein
VTKASTPELPFFTVLPDQAAHRTAPDVVRERDPAGVR